MTEQGDYVKEFHQKMSDYLIPFNDVNEKDDVIYYCISFLLADDILTEVFDTDVGYSSYSLMFVYAYLTYHTQSLFMSTMGVILIVLSFPVSQFIYTGILRISFYSTLN
jgi:hypothetical protein